ncbi:MAG: nickel pincer cofactor biosynthesis protein LarB [Cyclobacteriaceae bacterium]|nr:nickel pincer cofactor biosynthesis protein LarB [Cyclobacteriaceae bacterium]
MNENFRIDYQREERIGFQEVVFGASKTIAQLDAIIRDFQQHGKSTLITRVQKEKADVLCENFSPCFYDVTSQIFLAGQFPTTTIEGEIAILSGGTSDQYLVDEIYHTLHFVGRKAARFQDIGVAGVHRLLGNIEALRKFKVLIVVAGFEGALPTVVGGLLPQPIIAVPASVGYGVSAGGKAALYSMLSSCANGISVVNIDNGYGAAMAAFRIVSNLK